MQNKTIHPFSKQPLDYQLLLSNLFLNSLSAYFASDSIFTSENLLKIGSTFCCCSFAGVGLGYPSRQFASASCKRRQNVCFPNPRFETRKKEEKQEKQYYLSGSLILEAHFGLYSPGQADLQFSLYDTQILCEIKFADFRRYKTAILAILEVLNFDF